MVGERCNYERALAWRKRKREEEERGAESGRKVRNLPSATPTLISYTFLGEQGVRASVLYLSIYLSIPSLSIYQSTETEEDEVVRGISIEI